MKVTLSNLLLCLACVCALTACSTTRSQPSLPEPVPEIMPGILQGYLPMDAPMRSEVFVPAAPEEGGARQQLDNTVSAYALTLRDTPRWEMAVRDAHLRFPDAADTFACALDLPVSERDTPALYMLLRRTLADVGLASSSAKKLYNRNRPFMANGEPICTPGEEDSLRKNGSYPSGHTSIGWGWALILAELAPDRAEAVLARGRAFGESRIVCNVHWYSDVVAGRMVGAAAVARLQANEDFAAAMELARADIDRARQAGLRAAGDCARQEQGLLFAP